VPLVVDEFTARCRLGRGWLRAVGRWIEDPVPPHQEGIGADEGAGEATQKHPSNHPTSQHGHRNMFEQAQKPYSGKERHRKHVLVRAETIHRHERHVNMF
jgi:hypothetical protein